jgi:hypothetical protein
MRDLLLRMCKLRDMKDASTSNADQCDVRYSAAGSSDAGMPLVVDAISISANASVAASNLKSADSDLFDQALEIDKEGNAEAMALVESAEEAPAMFLVVC